MPNGDRISVVPSVDPSWSTFRMTRRFRGATYHIRFENPHGVEHGVQSITLDGHPIAGTLLPLPTATHHEVSVVMG